jgi:hypothetical protein
MRARVRSPVRPTTLPPWHPSHPSRAAAARPRAPPTLVAGVTTGQTPTEPDDPVTLELLRLMGSDSSVDVRLVALKSVGLSRHTLPLMLRRARDVKPEVT